MHVIPFLILFGAVVIAVVCYVINRRRIGRFTNALGSFLAFGAALQIFLYLFAAWALSRGITEAVPNHPEMAIQNYKHGDTALALVGMTMAWYALWYALRWLIDRRGAKGAQHGR